MPIYAYRCSACGHAQDVLQKLSDPVLTLCSACGASAYEKQVTAAGFQLKGSGWYVTDFRNGNTGAKPEAKPGDAKPDEAKPGDTKPGEAKPADAAKADAAAPAAAPAAAAAPATAPAAAPPATGSGSS